MDVAVLVFLLIIPGWYLKDTNCSFISFFLDAQQSISAVLGAWNAAAAARAGLQGGCQPLFPASDGGGQLNHSTQNSQGKKKSR